MISNLFWLLYLFVELVKESLDIFPEILYQQDDLVKFFKSSIISDVLLSFESENKSSSSVMQCFSRSCHILQELSISAPDTSLNVSDVNVSVVSGLRNKHLSANKS